MLRHERRVLIDCLGIGIGLTMLVVAADVSGALGPFENFLYDVRARFCQLFVKPPSDKLVHLDIDDKALETIGRMPWPRATSAQVLDEVHLAGPKAVELDLLLSEPQRIEYEPIIRDDGGPATLPATRGSTTMPVDCLPVDHDAQLAAAFARLGNVIIPGTFEPVPIEGPRYRAIIAEFMKDLEWEEVPLGERIGQMGFMIVPGDRPLGDDFIVARRDAIVRRLKQMRAGPDMSFEQVRAQLMPKTPVEVKSGAVNVLREQWNLYLAARAFQRFSLPPPSGIGRYVSMRIKDAPIQPLTQTSATGAFVDYTQFGSPVIRSLPLLLEQDGRFYPQMGLALATRLLDGDLQRMRTQGNRLIVPRAGGNDIVIPLAPPRVSTDGFVFGNLMDIPWFGGSRWEPMYDPQRKINKQHIPMSQVWQACVGRQKLILNNRAIDDAIRGIYQISKDTARLEQYNANMPPPEDFETRAKIARKVVEDWAPFMVGSAGVKLEELPREDRVFYASFNGLRDLLRLTPPIIAELNGFRSLLSTALKDKGVIVGWTATAAIADFVPTSLHEKAPGVVVHGVIANGVLTGELWSRAPWWTAEVIAGVLGVFTALAVGFFSPVRGLLLALGIAFLFAVINGWILFDFANQIVGTAAPFTTIAVVWGGCTLTRVMVEQRERARITRRFSSYADSKLVDYVLESEHLTFEGEDREVTVVFTDLRNFTALSEKLGAKIVPVLNELLDQLVPVIREHHAGYVNKFIGDGIMFFYNAPLQNNDHAAQAVSTVLDMHKKVAEFNIRLRERGLPELGMRGGIASGVVVVGDAGGGGRSDYTCLGDAVNLSSRLEAANKAVGTNTLMNDRARELLNGEFLLRPIGRIVVVGKEEAVMCYEPLARTAEATDAHRDLAEVTRTMVEAFIARDFDKTRGCADEIDAKHGPSKLTAIYRSMAEQYRESRPPADFDGRIVLTEK